MCHRLNHLLRLLGETLRHALRLLRGKALKLVEERHLLDFFLGIFFDLGFLARDLSFVDFPFALVREVGAAPIERDEAIIPARPAMRM